MYGELPYRFIPTPTRTPPTKQLRRRQPRQIPPRRGSSGSPFLKPPPPEKPNRSGNALVYALAALSLSLFFVAIVLGLNVMVFFDDRHSIPFPKRFTRKSAERREEHRFDPVVEERHYDPVPVVEERHRYDPAVEDMKPIRAQRGDDGGGGMKREETVPPKKEEENAKLDTAGELEAMRKKQVRVHSPKNKTKTENEDEEGDRISEEMLENLIEIRDTDYFFASESVEEGGGWAILPFAVDCPEGLGEEGVKVDIVISLWVKLSPVSSNEERKERVIFTTKPSNCQSDRFGGVRLFVDTAQHLVLEYAKETESRLSEGCVRVESKKKPVPSEVWTQLGVSFLSEQCLVKEIKLFIDGNIVAEHTEIQPKAAAPQLQHPLQLNSEPYHLKRLQKPITRIGANIEGEGYLEGRVSTMAIWKRQLKKNLFNYEYLIKAAKRAGFDERDLKHLENQGLVDSPSFIYPFDGQGGEAQKEVTGKLRETMQEKHGKLHRGTLFQNFIPLGGNRYAEYREGSSPKLIYEEMLQKSNQLGRERREHVANAVKHAWEGYKANAWGKDELRPVSKSGHNNGGQLANTLVDALDTLWILGMKDEFMEGRNWVRDQLSFERTGGVSVSETTARTLGGLLSAYDLSADKVFLDKANDLGQRLILAFNSPSGIPFGKTILSDGRSFNIGWLGGNAILSELGTLDVEFRYLAKTTGNWGYAEKTNNVFDKLSSLNPRKGLYPTYIRNESPLPEFANQKITMGDKGGSFYEYLLKTWLQGGRREVKYRKLYDRAMDGVAELLVQKTYPSGLTYIAEYENGQIVHRMEHSVCAMAGLLALGAYTHPKGLKATNAQRDLRTGKALAYTCYQMYARMETGLAPSYILFDSPDTDFSKPTDSPSYALRSEFVESLFILNHLTGDPVYREWGWEVFQAIERFCHTEEGYGSLRDVEDSESGVEDRMDSSFLGETLKFLYLLMDPDEVVDVLNEYVFNSKAHPLKTFHKVDTGKAWLRKRWG